MSFAGQDGHNDINTNNYAFFNLAAGHPPFAIDADGQTLAGEEMTLRRHTQGG